ncbi:MAG: hypothetical protein K0S33_2353 [Bacteroidetes bacterium]|jgi:hypothetical protein|nr:hypothetical protein [Bacteroidota bacterium]
MKKIALLGLIAVFGLAFIYKPSVTLDTYKVIKVTGTITYKKNNKSVLQGDLFPENEQIVFKTTESKAAVISTAKGRFILAPGAERNSAVKANLLPASSNISSRSGAVINIIDLQNMFTGNYVVLGKSRIHINKDNFPMNDNSFFFLRYKYKGEDINKKLSNEGEKLIFDKEQILMVDGKPITAFDSPEVKLFYSSNGASSQLINSFNLYMPSDEELKKETQILLNEIKDKPYTAKVDEFLAYMNDFYGKANKQSAMDWLKTNFALEP